MKKKLTIALSALLIFTLAFVSLYFYKWRKFNRAIIYEDYKIFSMMAEFYEQTDKFMQNSDDEGLLEYLRAYTTAEHINNIETSVDKSMENLKSYGKMFYNACGSDEKYQAMYGYHINFIKIAVNVANEYSLDDESSVEKFKATKIWVLDLRRQAVYDAIEKDRKKLGKDADGTP